MNRVQYGAAIKARVEHALTSSGYYFVGAPTAEAPAGVKTGQMGLATGFVDGSTYLLQPPNGAGPVAASWTAAEVAWIVPGGSRMAFTHAYLDGHGWAYVGPASAEG